MLHKDNLGKISAAVCILLLTFALAVGVTQARYNNTTSWTGVYSPGVSKITSDRLKQEGQTILLQAWEAVPDATRTEDIKVFSSKGDAYVTVQCSTDSDYITAELEQSTLYATQAGTTVGLKLTVTEKARQLTQITQAKVSITMKNGDQSKTWKADYQVQLMPEGTQLSAPTVGELQSNLTVSPDRQGRAFAWNEKMVFTLTADQNTDMIELSYGGESFPKGTRYTVNLEQYVLADAMKIRIPVTAGTPVPISLDFSETGITPGQTVQIVAEAYLGNQITGRMDFTADSTRRALEFGGMDTNTVLHGSGSLAIPVFGDEDGLMILIQHLEMTNSGAMYLQSDLLDVDLQPIQESEGQYILEISNQAGKAPAGTYRVTLIRMCCDKIVNTCQINFFLHY